METNLKWKKGFFSNVYQIYSNGQQIGELKDKSFSQVANGVFNGQKYTFKTKGFFKQHTVIIDSIEGKVIGEITYNTWMTKATISVNDKKFNWRYDNLWNTRWRIYDSAGVNIKYAGSSTSGQIESNIDAALLFLCGLLVTNYYWQMTIAVLVAVLVPILMK